MIGDETRKTLVSLRRAGVNRGGRWILRNVDLAVRAGELVTLIGPNGAGKTTAAKLTIDLIKADEGAVARAPDLRAGYVPQKIDIDRSLPLSVRRLMTLSAKHSDNDVDAALSAVGMTHLARAQIRDLSGGELQRALLARAMINRPNLLVLDEPVRGVDIAGELALYDLISQARRKTGCGILLISHDLHVVMAETDTVVCLNGHVCCTGSAESVAGNPEYIRLFGRRAAQALAFYRHQHDHTHLPDGRVRYADGSITGSHQAHDAHGGKTAPSDTL